VTSIRSFLIVGIVATLTLFNFVAAFRGYQSSMLEAERLFDNQLLDYSQLILDLDVSRVGPDFRIGSNLAFQLWQDDSLLFASHGAPGEAISAGAPGFDFANFGGYRWRTFTRREEASGRWLVVAERSDLRYVLAENVVLQSLTPILLGIPVVALLIWLMVSRGLKPLQQLSDDLRVKKAQDLQPLHYERTPAELGQVLQSMNGFILRLREALEREQRFSADAAHELRTPISALKIQLHNLSREVDTNSESWQQLQHGVERMQHLIEQLLSLYRSTPERFAAECTELDLLALTQDAVARFYPMIEARGQSLELDGEPARIRGERFALDTMLANLLSNASKYTPPGGRIQLRLQRQQGRICLVVEDDGPGIPPEEREHVFGRFYRVAGEQNSAVQGCGLGLTIVQHVASLHQASVEITDSSLGSGVAFRICFPELSA
jgi:two-component system sensor histidine kinase QseC